MNGGDDIGVNVILPGEGLEAALNELLIGGR